MPDHLLVLRLAQDRSIEVVYNGKLEHRITIGLGWSLGKARREDVAFEVRFEALRLDAANDDRAPEHRTGLRMSARW